MNCYCNRPRVKAAINEACSIYGLSIEQLFAKGPSGKKSLRKEPLRAARYHVIRKLYDPVTAVSGGTRVNLAYGASEIARVLEIDHTTVVYAVKKMGIHPHVKQS